MKIEQYTQQDTQDTEDLTREDWIEIWMEIFTLVERELIEDDLLDITEAKFWKTPNTCLI